MNFRKSPQAFRVGVNIETLEFLYTKPGFRCVRSGIHNARPIAITAGWMLDLCVQCY